MYNYFVFLLYKYTIMLFKTSQNQKKIREELVNICGKAYTLLEKIKYGFYGSPKYLLLNIRPTSFDIDFENYNDLVYCTIEMRTKGSAIYFRHKNEEYVLMSRYNQMSFLNNDGKLEAQVNNYILKLKIADTKAHKKFMQSFMKSRNFSSQ